MIIFKIKNSSQKGCPFCREAVNPINNLNHYHETEEFELTNSEKNNIELKKRYSIDEMDWLFP